MGFRLEVDFGGRVQAYDFDVASLSVGRDAAQGFVLGFSEDLDGQME